MATTRGCFGKIKSRVNGASGGLSVVGEARNWSYEETAEQLDASAMGDCTKKFVAGAQQTTGTVQTFWDSADAGQGVFTVGATVDLELYPGGSGSGNAFYKTATGGATITSVARSGGVDNIVENNFGFTVNGALIATSVP
jgi:hypothetical protein